MAGGPCRTCGCRSSTHTRLKEWAGISRGPWAPWPMPWGRSRPCSPAGRGKHLPPCLSCDECGCEEACCYRQLVCNECQKVDEHAESLAYGVHTNNVNWLLIIYYLPTFAVVRARNLASLSRARALSLYHALLLSFSLSLSPPTLKALVGSSVFVVAPRQRPLYV